MKSASTLLIQLGLFAVLSGSSGLLLAQPPEGRDGPPRPTKEAVESCKSSSADQACSFDSPNGPVNGICWAPEGKPLACKPKDAPGGKSRPSKQSSAATNDERKAVLEKIAFHYSATGLARM
jgi:hypothetical protein